MTTTNTPFEDSVDEILLGMSHDYQIAISDGDDNVTLESIRGATKNRLTQLHKAAIVAELEAIRDMDLPVTTHNKIIDRIGQYKKEGR